MKRFLLSNINIFISLKNKNNYVIMYIIFITKGISFKEKLIIKVQ